MLVACRLAGLSALETHNAGLNAHAVRGPPPRPRRHCHAQNLAPLVAKCTLALETTNFGSSLIARAVKAVQTVAFGAQGSVRIGMAAAVCAPTNNDPT